MMHDQGQVEKKLLNSHPWNSQFHKSQKYENSKKCVTNNKDNWQNKTLFDELLT